MLIIKCKDGSTYNFSAGKFKRWDLYVEGMLHVVIDDNSETFYPLCNIVCFSYEEVKNAD